MYYLYNIFEIGIARLSGKIICWGKFSSLFPDKVFPDKVYEMQIPGFGSYTILSSYKKICNPVILKNIITTFKVK